MQMIYTPERGEARTITVLHWALDGYRALILDPTTNRVISVGIATLSGLMPAQRAAEAYDATLLAAARKALDVAPSGASILMALSVGEAATLQAMRRAVDTPAQTHGRAVRPLVGDADEFHVSRRTNLARQAREAAERQEQQTDCDAPPLADTQYNAVYMKARQGGASEREARAAAYRTIGEQDAVPPPSEGVKQAVRRLQALPRDGYDYAELARRVEQQYPGLMAALTDDAAAQAVETGNHNHDNMTKRNT